MGTGDCSGKELLRDPPELLVAGITTVLATIISIFQIVGHLRYYLEPTFQRYIVRIIFAVPVYAIASFTSLVFSEQHLYFETLRDLYEAWILYNFLCLCLAYLGGPGAVVVKSEGKVLEPSWKWTTCCLPPMPVNGQFIRHTKQGVLQFVLLKPVLAILILILDYKDHYNEGNWDASDGYLWVQIVYNVLYTLALYSLVVFYQGTEELLAPFHPLIKFLLIKAVIFFTFWQGLFISIIYAGRCAQNAKNLQNFLISVEMLGAAWLMWFAFPYTDYKIAGANTGLGRGNIGHAISIQDVVNDTVHQFAPHYHDYVLYSDSNTGGKQLKKHIRTRTFVKIGDETNRYRDSANLLANMEAAPDRPQPTIYEEASSARESAQGDDTPKLPEAGAIEMPDVRYDSSMRRANAPKKEASSKTWEHIDLGSE
eukprot:evm.model.scf_63.20 EVM.evm.TU.scf_63.20   scf_63:139344-146569(+)